MIKSKKTEVATVPPIPIQIQIQIPTQIQTRTRIRTATPVAVKTPLQIPRTIATLILKQIIPTQAPIPLIQTTPQIIMRQTPLQTIIPPSKRQQVPEVVEVVEGEE